MIAVDTGAPAYAYLALLQLNLAHNSERQIVEVSARVSLTLDQASDSFPQSAARAARSRNVRRRRSQLLCRWSRKRR